MINPRIKIRRFDLPNGISGHLAAEDGFIFSASGFEKDAPDDADMLHWYASEAEAISDEGDGPEVVFSGPADEPVKIIARLPEYDTPAGQRLNAEGPEHE